LQQSFSFARNPHKGETPQRNKIGDFAFHKTSKIAESVVLRRLLAGSVVVCLKFGLYFAP
jgi:hypothetical protein